LAIVQVEMVSFAESCWEIEATTHLLEALAEDDEVVQDMNGSMALQVGNFVPQPECICHLTQSLRSPCVEPFFTS
jgi:hypothetical protein